MKAGVGFELLRFADRKSFMNYAEGPIRHIRAKAEESLIHMPFPRQLPAYCSCCRSYVPTIFNAMHSTVREDGSLELALSETGVCPTCRINSRMRAAVDIAEILNIREDSNIYMTEQTTFLFSALKKHYSRITGSEYLGPDKTPGKTYEGICHQDLHALTFEDGKFDFVICLDVLEHVNDPITVLSEIHRVLKAGGKAIITFPFFWNRDDTVRRASIDALGNINHILSPEYHGNPLGGGSLVFNEFSWNFIADVQAAFVGRCQFLHYWSLYRGHFGLARFALVLEG